MPKEAAFTKFVAPEGVTSINIGGEQFNVGDDGMINVPVGYTAESLGSITSHGFTAFDPATKTKAATVTAAAAAVPPPIVAAPAAAAPVAI